MKLCAYLLFALSMFLAVDAAREQISGDARAWSPGKDTLLVQARKERNPRAFNSIMAYEWIRAATVCAAGYFLLSRVRRANRLASVR